MKKLTLILSVVALCIAAGLTTLAVINRYHGYQMQQQLKVEQAKASVTARDAEARNIFDEQLNQVRQEVATLKTECQKGQAAYDKLSPYIKTQTPAPTCS